MSLAYEHMKKHGCPIVYTRQYGSQKLSTKDYNSQYSVVYTPDYEFSTTRRVVISTPRTQIVSFFTNNPISHNRLVPIHKKGFDTIDISRNSPECIIRDDYII